VTEVPVPDLRILSKGAAAGDVAAVTAVLRNALDELAAGLELDEDPAVSAWGRSQRPIRGTITRGRGAWRGFSG
jgi:phage-related protein